MRHLQVRVGGLKGSIGTAKCKGIEGAPLGCLGVMMVPVAANMRVFKTLEHLWHYRRQIHLPHVLKYIGIKECSTEVE